MTSKHVTDWTVGAGLNELGLPDPGWTTFCEVYPIDEDKVEGTTWRCKVVFGSTWAHLHFGHGNTPARAMREAFTSAVEAGMPIRWAPDDLDL